MKRALPVADCVSGFVTTISFAPAALAGVVAAIVVAVMGPTTALTPPIVTVAPATKPVPVMRIEVPPMVDPDVGLTDEIVGAGNPIAWIWGDELEKTWRTTFPCVCVTSTRK